MPEILVQKNVSVMTELNQLAEYFTERLNSIRDKYCEDRTGIIALKGIGEFEIDFAVNFDLLKS